MDEGVCLGDLVGYGASPNEVTERLLELNLWLKAAPRRYVMRLATLDDFRNYVMHAA